MNVFVSSIFSVTCQPSSSQIRELLQMIKCDIDYWNWKICLMWGTRILACLGLENWYICQDNHNDTLPSELIGRCRFQISPPQYLDYFLQISTWRIFEDPKFEIFLGKCFQCLVVEWRTLGLHYSHPSHVLPLIRHCQSWGHQRGGHGSRQHTGVSRQNLFSLVQSNINLHVRNKGTWYIMRISLDDVCLPSGPVHGFHLKYGLLQVHH